MVHSSTGLGVQDQDHVSLIRKVALETWAPLTAEVSSWKKDRESPFVSDS